MALSTHAGRVGALAAARATGAVAHPQPGQAMRCHLARPLRFPAALRFVASGSSVPAREGDAGTVGLRSGTGTACARQVAPGMCRHPCPARLPGVSRAGRAAALIGSITTQNYCDS